LNSSSTGRSGQAESHVDQARAVLADDVAAARMVAICAGSGIASNETTEKPWCSSTALDRWRS